MNALDPIALEPGNPIGEQAQQLIHQLCAEMEVRYGKPPSPFSASEMLKDREIFLLARIGAELVGCGALRYFNEEAAEIKRMFVKPEWRGQGVARKIIAELERHTAAFGYQSIVLETGILQPEAQAAYQKAGYTRIPNFGVYVGNPTSVCFQKMLQAENQQRTPFQIIKDDLSGAEIAASLSEHLRCMHQNSPPGSVHALDLAKLRKPEITFWSVWSKGQLAGCAALKELDPTHGEVKSMRTASNFLRQGIASAVLSHIISQAKVRGYERLSLETGARDYFKPAHHLYRKHGFKECARFGDYPDDPNSVFMTRNLKSK